MVLITPRSRVRPSSGPSFAVSDDKGRIFLPSCLFLLPQSEYWFGFGHWPRPEDGIDLAVTGPLVREIEDRHENGDNKTVYVQSINGYQEKASSGSRTAID